MPFFKFIYLSVFLFLLYLAPTTLLAQKKNWQDVVYLHNGSILRGYLTDDSTEEIIKLEITGKNLFVFSKAEVSRVTREYTRSDFKYPYTKGYQNITELGISVGNASAGEFGFARKIDISTNTFNGYLFNPHLALGFSTGVDTYDQLTYLPVGIGLRGDFTKTQVRPYYSFDTGYTLDWLNNPNLPGNYEGGFFWNPAVGIKFNSRKYHAFLLTIGFKNQLASFTRTDGIRKISEERVFKRALFRMGFCF